MNIKQLFPRFALMAVLTLLALPFLLGSRTALAGVTTLWVNDDKPAVGYPAGTSCDNPDFNSIQPAVNNAPAGATINVCAGTYTEQVTVPAGKNNLTLRSVTPLAAIIKAPLTMPPAALNAQSSIVRISTSQNVTLRSFTITGPGPGPCGSIGNGVRVDGGGSANILYNHITDIRDNPFSGCQNGVAIRVGRQFEAETGRAQIIGNVIDNYQKNGPTIDNAGSSAEIAYNQISGIGPTGVIAQNGIQISRGATANVHDNQVSDHAYIQPIPCVVNATCVTATGILIFETNNIVVANNQLRRNQDGIDLYTANNNRVSSNSVIGGIPGFGPSYPCCNTGAGIFADTDTVNNLIEKNFLRDNVQYDCQDESVGPYNSPALVANPWVNDDGVTQNKPGLCHPGPKDDRDFHKHKHHGDDDKDDDD